MTAAYRFKGLGWFAACVAVILAFYLVSLQVAAERKKLDEVNARIRVAERDIRALETEFDTRANLAQLERWNGDTLALAAPVASQFVTDEAQLASVSFTPLPDDAEVKTAALVVPSLPVPSEPAEPVIAPAIVVQPTAPAPALVRVVARAPAGAAKPELVRVSAPAARTERTAKPARVSSRAAAKAAPVLIQAATSLRATPRPMLIRASATVPARPKRQVAMLDRKLLSDSTFGDILSGARAEAAKLR